MNAVRFHRVSKRRKNFQIENINFTVPTGYITGLIGPNGSGKTTLLHLMMDILQVDDGTIEIFGEHHQKHHLKQKIGFVYDHLYMYEHYTIQKMKSFIAPLYDNWNEELFQKYLEKFELPFRQKIKHFSQGMKMKGSLLFALSHQPELIVMDEPTNGLDPIVRRELLEIFQQLMIHEEQTILLSTHLTNDLDQIADYILLIQQGELIFQKSIEEIHDQFYLVQGGLDFLDSDVRKLFVHVIENNVNFTGLLKGTADAFNEFQEELVIKQPTLEEIMYFYAKKNH